MERLGSALPLSLQGQHSTRSLTFYLSLLSSLVLDHKSEAKNTFWLFFLLPDQVMCKVAFFYFKFFAAKLAHESMCRN